MVSRIKMLNVIYYDLIICDKKYKKKEIYYQINLKEYIR